MGRNCHDRSKAGFTLVEILVTLCVFTLAGGLIFFFLNSGMTLYAKNTAVNASHQKTRSSLDKMLSNINDAVSIPQLVDFDAVGRNFIPLAAPGTGPAVGVSFQQFDAGPFLLWTGGNVPASQTFVIIAVPATNPPTLPATTNTTGLRFNIPSHKVELDVTSIGVIGNFRVINFATPVGTAEEAAAGKVKIITKADGSGNGNGNLNNTSNIIGFTTRRVTYAVMGGNASGTSTVNAELRYYPTNNCQPLVCQRPDCYTIAGNITYTTASPPFKILFNQQGGADFRSVATVDLSAVPPNRGYLAVNMGISSKLPFRSDLTVYQ
jgi:hypothetical protein